MKSKRAIFVLETREWLALSPRTDKEESMMHIDDVEYAIELAEQEAEERCKNTFCQVLHELVMNKLDGANAVERYEQLLNGEQIDE